MSADLVTEGLIWKGDHLEPLGAEQYGYWMTHPLPRGWSIIRPPLEWSRGP